MAELAYPYYQVQADGPAETGFVIQLNIGKGAGGPLPGQSVESVIEGLKQQLTGDGVTLQVTRYEVTTTNDL